MDAVALKNEMLNKVDISPDPNALQWLLKRLDYNPKPGDTSFARAGAPPHEPIAANSASTVKLGFDISFAKLEYSAYQLLLGANADYRLDRCHDLRRCRW